MCLQTMELMKAGLEDAGLKAYLMAQPVGFHTEELNKSDQRLSVGYGSLADYPFCELCEIVFTFSCIIFTHSFIHTPTHPQPQTIFIWWCALRPLLYAIIGLLLKAYDAMECASRQMLISTGRSLNHTT